MPVERRKHARFLPHADTFAALGQKYSRVGKVKDISLGGLSIEYITGEDTNQHFSAVDVFLVGNIFHLHNVPCKIAYDLQIHVPHVNNRFIKILTTKRCGLKFKELSEGELTQLKLFLEAHTEGILK